MTKQNFMKRIATYLVLLLTCVTAKAAIVTGRVYNPEYNEGEPFATIRIYSGKNTKPVTTAVSDIDGNFSIDLKNRGDYRIEISAVSKEPAVRNFTIGDGNEVNLGDVVLKNDSKSLAEVTVVAQRPLVEMSTDEMTYNVSSDNDSRTYTLLEMLRKVPMVTVDGEDNITVNGSSNFQVYVDGKPSLLFSGNPSQIFKSMPASAVQKIEVVTNPGARYDAEGVGGVLNLVMNKAGGGALDDIKAYNVNVGVRGGNKGFGGNIYVNGQVGKFSASLNMIYNHALPGTSSMTTERKENETLISSFSSSKPRLPFMMGNLSLEYAFDNLTSLGASFSLNGFSHKANGIINTSISLQNADILSYLDDSSMKNRRQGLNGSLNFSRAFDEERNNQLQITYQIGNETQKNFSANEFEVLFPADASMDGRTSDSRLKTLEQIALADFSSKFGNNSVSVGLKGTFRSASADNSYLVNGILDDAGSLVYKNNSNIGAVYGEYAFKHDFFSLKAGLRYEHTWQSIDYSSGNIDGYKNNYGNFVPSGSLGFNLSRTSNIGINYNMRISRPGISYLNPYVNQADPTQITFGNPDLQVEKTHNAALVYNLFLPKFSFNATLSNSYTGNGIEQYSFMDQGVMNTTYGNIVKRNNTTLSIFANWLIGTKTRIFLNGSGSWLDIRSSELDARNHGLQGTAMLGVQQQLPHSFSANVFMMASTKSRTLQGWNTGFRMLSLNLSKSFIEDRLGISLGFNTGLSRKGHMEMDTYVETPQFTNHTKIRVPMLAVNLGITFRFGSKAKAKEVKVNRIDNDFIDTRSQMENVSNSEQQESIR